MVAYFIKASKGESIGRVCKQDSSYSLCRVITDVKSYQLGCILLVKSKSQILPTLKGRGWHRSMNARRWELGWGGKWHFRVCLPQWPCTVLAKITLMCECIQNHKLEHKEKSESSLCIYAIREEGFCKLIHCICSYLSASNSQIIPALEPELECSSPVLAAALPMNLHCIQTQLLFWGHSLRDVEKLFPRAWMMVFRRVHV